MAKYLYGASVQGIQGFIFQTNKLQDIVGSSELVERACTTLFDEFKEDNREPILKAAGNVKYEFHSEAALRKAVLLYPKRVMEEAPGITVSQAVVEYDENFENAVNELELRLRAQRNRQSKSMTMGNMAMERSRKTGLPAVKRSEGDYVDEGTDAKRQAADNESLFETLYGKSTSFKRVLNLNQLTDKNDWIAIIHADGNGLGEIVSKKKRAEELRDFSRNLNNSTIDAARKACEEIHEGRKQALIRPIVIGGDDLTVICRADVAVPFVKKYLKYFEDETEKNISEKLTACAGISFVKASYPFYFGYDLAETLCSEAKKDAKSDVMKRRNDGETASCLMFHKVQSSFVEDYSVIKMKELMPSAGLSFCFGPYYLKEQGAPGEDSFRWSIDSLENEVESLSRKDDNNMIKTRVREWMTVVHEGKEKARQIEERVNNLDLYGIDQKKLFSSLVTPILRNGENRCPAYDVLALHTINNQETR